MNLFHGLQQKLDNSRMQVAANQNFGRSADKLHICGRDILVDIDHTLRQNEAIKVWENTRKGFGICEAH
jgi:CDP-diacylglycerol pyrophosphatase